MACWFRKLIIADKALKSIVSRCAVGHDSTYYGTYYALEYDKLRAIKNFDEEIAQDLSKIVDHVKEVQKLFEERYGQFLVFARNLHI